MYTKLGGHVSFISRFQFSKIWIHCALVRISVLKAGRKCRGDAAAKLRGALIARKRAHDNLMMSGRRAYRNIRVRLGSVEGRVASQA